MNPTTNAKIMPNCLPGTRPIIIIMNTTADNRAAVEKFSTKISGITAPQMSSMYFKASLSAPFSVCMALSIWAVANTKAPFANSEGWNWNPMIPIHLDAPLVALPVTHTINNSNIDPNSKNGVMILKYLHCMLRVTTILAMPRNSRPMCLNIGAM